LFKRILLTAVLGAGLVLSVPFSAAQAEHRGGGGDRDRRDWGIRFGGPWGYYPGLYNSTGTPAVPNLHYRGFDRRPEVWWWPAGFGAGRTYFGNGYYPGDVPLIVGDPFGDNYFVTYGYRCNGYRDGYFSAERPHRLDLHQRRNADCETYYRNHGSWYGFSDCGRYSVEHGYCDDYDRNGHQRF